MRRYHMVEIEDLPWLPAPIRDGATDYLQFVLSKTQPYKPIVPRLAEALEKCGTTQVIDLCSGAGGPWAQLLPALTNALGKPVNVHLTDYYPNLPAWKKLQDQFPGQVTYAERPVDARNIPPHMTGFRTLFSGFHHFRPIDAVGIIQGAVRSRQGIGIFEATERSGPAVLGMLFVPLMIALVTPAIRPFRWSRLFFTYPLPAIPFMGLVDGVVSCLRTYTPDELNQMAAIAKDYTWEIGKQQASRLPVPVTYSIGYPQSEPVLSGGTSSSQPDQVDKAS
jgi:hypothetical protein